MGFVPLGRTLKPGMSAPWYFQQFCSHKKKKAYWEAIKTDLTPKLNDAEKEAIEKEINRTRYDVKQEILEKYEEYLGKHKMPYTKKARVGMGGTDAV